MDMVSEYLEPLVASFSQNADADKAAPMAKYMLNQFPFLGIPAPQRKELSRNFLNTSGYPLEVEFDNVVMACWDLPEREYQYFAMFMMERKAKKSPRERIGLYEKLILEKSWWDTVDFLAGNLAGSYFEAFPDLIVPTTRQWMGSGNMWLQRSSLLFQLKYRKQTDVDLLFKYILDLASSSEFFIQKAIGWTLREYSKTDADAVLQFVDRYTLAPLSKREALKWINRTKG
jgi:3-methyladenine DNA glycosylase AlkD